MQAGAASRAIPPFAYKRLSIGDQKHKMLARELVRKVYSSSQVLMFAPLMCKNPSRRWQGKSGPVSQLHALKPCNNEIKNRRQVLR
jgi:hypothetical protein